MAAVISSNLQNNNTHILYIIGGDNSLRVAHEIAPANPTRCVVGMPKTMNNDREDLKALPDVNSNSGSE